MQGSDFERLPMDIRKLVQEPCFNFPDFSTINLDNVKNLVNSVKTKTVIDLLKPVQITGPDPIINLRPIVLVFCQPSEEISIEPNQVFPYAPISYMSWLEGAGAKCVPIAYNINEGSMEFLIERSHGLLIPGGGSNLYKNFNKKEGQGPVMVGFLKIWRFIQKLWSKGVRYPIWGTCLGLEMMLLALSGDTKVLSSLNSRGHQLEVYSDYQNSSFLKKMPTSLRIRTQNFKLLNFQHSYGISLKKFLSQSKLQERLKVTQISKDKDGKWFCSGLEGKNHPIIITQYHPQKQAYQWSRTGEIKHNKDSIQVSQFLAASFLSQCRACQSTKQFGSPLEQLFYSAHQYKQIHTQKMYKVYAIDFKFRDYDKETRKDIKNKRSESTRNKVRPVFI